MYFTSGAARRTVYIESVSEIVLAGGVVDKYLRAGRWGDIDSVLCKSLNRAVVDVQRSPRHKINAIESTSKPSKYQTSQGDNASRGIDVNCIRPGYHNCRELSTGVDGNGFGDR